VIDLPFDQDLESGMMMIQIQAMWSVGGEEIASWTAPTEKPSTVPYVVPQQRLVLRHDV